MKIGGFTINIKPIKSKKASTAKSVVERKILAIIKEVEENKFVAYVQDNKTEYPLTEKSYDCTGRPSIWRLNKIKGVRWEYIRNLRDINCNTYGHIPFDAGHIVTGNIVKENNVLYFHITKYYDKY